MCGFGLVATFLPAAIGLMVAYGMSGGLIALM
jgi:hypothetical protein